MPIDCEEEEEKKTLDSHKSKPLTRLIFHSSMEIRCRSLSLRSMWCEHRCFKPSLDLKTVQKTSARPSDFLLNDRYWSMTKWEEERRRSNVLQWIIDVLFLGFLSQCVGKRIETNSRGRRQYSALVYLKLLFNLSDQVCFTIEPVRR